MTQIKLFYLLRHPLTLSSLFVFASTLAGNVFAYLFNLFAARLLGPADYGILAAIIALMGIFGVVAGALFVTVTKFVSEFKGRGQDEEITLFVRRLVLVFALLGLAVLAGFFVGRQPLAAFFNIASANALVLVGLAMAVSLLSMINLGTLSGLQHFGFLALANFLGSFLKFLFGVVFLLLGGRVGGAALAVVLAPVCVYFLTFFPLRKVFLGKVKTSYAFPLRRLWAYSLPALFSTWGLIALTSSDVVLVKKYFDAETTGLYSFAALIGRVIFFASSSISTVMFPVVSERQAGGRRHDHILVYVLIVVAVVSLAIDAFYFLFSDFTIRFFSGFGKSSYLEAGRYVGLLGLYYAVFSLASLLINYFLSLRRLWPAVIWPALAALLQIVLIRFFHADVTTVIRLSLVVGVCLLSVDLFYFWRQRYER